jgi:hypothetical protein
MKIPGNQQPETDFYILLMQVRSLIEKYENELIDGVGLEELIRIRHKLFELQMQKFSAYIDDISQSAIIPEEDENLNKETMNLMVRLNDLIEG